MTGGTSVGETAAPGVTPTRGQRLRSWLTAADLDKTILPSIERLREQ